MFAFAMIKEIVVLKEEHLYSIHWEEDDFHTLDKMSDSLSDATKLTDYFGQKDLSYFRISVQDAVIKTIQENQELLFELNEIAEYSFCGKTPDLDTVFEP